MTLDDIIKSSLYAFIVIVFITIGSLLFFSRLVNSSCEVLRDISSNENLANEIFHAAQIYLHKPHYYSQTGQKHGLMYVRDLDDKLTIDWDKLGIPLRVAAIEIRGKDINYKSIQSNKVEEIRVGFGYRKYLSYKINPSNPQSNRYELKVECVED